MKQTIKIIKGEDNQIRTFGYRQDNQTKFYFGVNYAKDFKKNVQKELTAQELIDEWFNINEHRKIKMYEFSSSRNETTNNSIRTITKWIKKRFIKIERRESWKLKY